MATRVAARFASRRLFSSGSGKVLGEKEKAVENAYFKWISVGISHLAQWKRKNRENSYKVSGNGPTDNGYSVSRHTRYYQPSI